jgi:hypothetical protein
LFANYSWIDYSWWGKCDSIDILFIDARSLSLQELIANACKALAFEQSTLGALLVAFSGFLYIGLSLLLLLIPGFSVENRHSVAFSLFLVIAALLYAKFRINNEGEDNFFLLASEAVPGLTKRLLLTVALACDPETSALGRVIHPFPASTPKKAKKE